MKTKDKKLSIQPLEVPKIPTKDECIQKAIDSLQFIKEVLEQALKTKKNLKSSHNSDFKAQAIKPSIEDIRNTIKKGFIAEIDKSGEPSSKPCPTCKGKGRVKSVIPIQGDLECPECKGQGFLKS